MNQDIKHGLAGFGRGLSGSLSQRWQQERALDAQDKRDTARALRMMKEPGQTVRYGDIFTDAPEALREQQIGLKQAFSLAPTITNLAKPSAEESKMAGQGEELFDLGKNLSSQWQTGELGKGTLGEAAKGAVAKYLPGQVSQRVVDPKYTEYQNTRSMAAEVALRAATGAATNPSEVKFYGNLLPEPGDNPVVAQNKIKNFYGRVISRAEQTAKNFEARGMPEAAKKQRMNNIARLAYSRDQMLESFGGPPEAAAQEPADAQDMDLPPLPGEAPEIPGQSADQNIENVLNEARAALNDPNAPEVVKSKAKQVLKEFGGGQ